MKTNFPLFLKKVTYNLTNLESLRILFVYILRVSGSEWTDSQVGGEAGVHGMNYFGIVSVLTLSFGNFSDASTKLERALRDLYDDSNVPSRYKILF